MSKSILPCFVGYSVYTVYKTHRSYQACSYHTEYGTTFRNAMIPSIVSARYDKISSHCWMLAGQMLRSVMYYSVFLRSILYASWNISSLGFSVGRKMVRSRSLAVNLSTGFSLHIIYAAGALLPRRPKARSEFRANNQYSSGSSKGHPDSMICSKWVRHIPASFMEKK